MLAVALALVSSSACAEWIRAGTTANGAIYYLDPARMRIVDGKVQLWVKMDHSRDRGVRYRTSMSLMGFDCAAQTWKLLSLTTQDSYGRTVDSLTSAPAYAGYEPITPDSVGENISRVACATDDTTTME